MRKPNITRKNDRIRILLQTNQTKPKDVFKS